MTLHASDARWRRASTPRGSDAWLQVLGVTDALDMEHVGDARAMFIGVCVGLDRPPTEELVFYPSDQPALERSVVMCEIPLHVERGAPSTVPAAPTAAAGRPGPVICHAMPFGLHGIAGLFDDRTPAATQEDMHVVAFSLVEDFALLLPLAPIVSLAIDPLPDSRTWLSTFNMVSSRDWAHKVGCYYRFVARHVAGIALPAHDWTA